MRLGLSEGRPETSVVAFITEAKAHTADELVVLLLPQEHGALQNLLKTPRQNCRKRARLSRWGDDKDRQSALLFRDSFYKSKKHAAFADSGSALREKL